MQTIGLWTTAFNMEQPFVDDRGMTGVGVRREKAALSQWVKAPPGKLLQPEATGATMEVTKWLKPPVKRVTNW
jgi:hypothetical protein